jgi:hypothetical protein
MDRKGDEERNIEAVILQMDHKTDRHIDRCRTDVKKTYVYSSLFSVTSERSEPFAG